MTLDITKCHAGGLDVSEECVSVCQHHGAEYAEFVPPATSFATNVHYATITNGSTIVQVTITITERCCVVVNAAYIGSASETAAHLEIERPVGTIRTQQEDELLSNAINLLHHAAWEVLPAGVYTYHLVNRKGASIYPYGAWIKAIASDCEG